MEKLVSIIIPVYNAEKYIAACIDSVLAQTWQNIEVIVVDDGSTDNSLKIIEQYVSKGVKILLQKNSGASTARNKGLDESTGDFIQFLDADDLLSPDKIEAQTRLLIKYPGHVSICSTVHFFDGEDLSKLHPSPYEDTYLMDSDDPAHFLLNLWGAYNGNGSMIQTNAWLVPKPLISKAGIWNEFRCPDDDGEFFCRVVLASQGVRFAKTGYNYYRKFRNLGSLSSQKSHASFRNILLSAKLKYQSLKAATNRHEVDKVFARNFFEIGILAYPQYPDVSKEAILLVHQLSLKVHPPVIGGYKIEFIKTLFGWRIARLLQHYFHNRYI
jgi:glycosyltransferase involved in cell wall biosynthesis